MKKKLITKTRTELSIAKTEIMELLKANGSMPENLTDFNVSVYFSVPGGGDWSNMNVEIDNENPVHVVYEDLEVSKT